MKEKRKGEREESNGQAAAAGWETGEIRGRGCAVVGGWRDGRQWTGTVANGGCGRVWWPWGLAASRGRLGLGAGQWALGLHLGRGLTLARGCWMVTPGPSQGTGGRRIGARFQPASPLFPHLPAPLFLSWSPIESLRLSSLAHEQTRLALPMSWSPSRVGGFVTEQPEASLVSPGEVDAA